MLETARITEDQLRCVTDAAKEHGFVVQSRIGAGATSVVLKALHVTNDLRQLCALKILVGPYDIKWHARFKREAELLSKLDHPGLVKVLPPGLVTLCAFPVFGMEYVEGVSLREWLNQHGVLEERKALQLALQIANVVQFVHDMKIIHRDLHAGNVMVVAGDLASIKVVDFGTALELSIPAIVDGPGYKTFRPIGSMSHCSPEKWLTPHRANVESDVFSLGVLLYNAVTGAYPFWDDDSYVKLYRLIVRGEHIPVGERNPELSAEFAELVEEMIESSAVFRIETMDEVRSRVEEILRSTGE